MFLTLREGKMKHVLAAVVSATAILVASAAYPQNVGIATSNPGSLFHNIGTAVANAANAAGLNTTIQAATSPNQFIPFIDQGGIEFGVANLQEVDYADYRWMNGGRARNLKTCALLRIFSHLLKRSSCVPTATS
jgi:uncharacterized protein